MNGKGLRWIVNVLVWTCVLVWDEMIPRDLVEGSGDASDGD